MYGLAKKRKKYADTNAMKKRFLSNDKFWMENYRKQ